MKRLVWLSLQSLLTVGKTAIGLRELSDASFVSIPVAEELEDNNLRIFDLVPVVEGSQTREVVAPYLSNP